MLVPEFACFYMFSGADYFVDAMSSFGAVPLDLKEANVDYIVSSANKCLEGVPGFSYVIARLDKLHKCKGVLLKGVMEVCTAIKVFV